MEDDVTMEVFCQAESRPPRAAVESYIWPAQIRASRMLCPRGTHSTCVLWVRLPSFVLPVILYQASCLLKKQERNTVLHGPDTPSPHLFYCQTVNLQGSAKAAPLSKALSTVSRGHLTTSQHPLWFFPPNCEPSGWKQDSYYWN